MSELICITCPVGCHLQVTKDESDSLVVTGNRCKRGIEYAREELTQPKRMVTATCAIASNEMNRVPVRTNRAVPKEMIDTLIKEIYRVSLTPPVKRGQVIIEDYQGTGIEVTASMTVLK